MMESPARCADRGLGCEFAKSHSSEPQAEGAGDTMMTVVIEQGPWAFQISAY
jgi:hypothetical protein